MTRTFTSLAFLLISVSAVSAASICKNEKPLNQSFKDKQAVLCCCPTFNGGQCCNNVQFCGTYIPGCNCKVFHGPQIIDRTANGLR